jgi:hypothetical protein
MTEPNVIFIQLTSLSLLKARTAIETNVERPAKAKKISIGIQWITTGFSPPTDRETDGRTGIGLRQRPALMAVGAPCTDPKCG